MNCNHFKTIARMLLVVSMLASWPTGSIAAPAAQSLQVIPQPRNVATGGADFDAKRARFIRVSNNSPDRFVAKLLQRSLRETHGVDCQIILTEQDAADVHRLWLGEQSEIAIASPEPPAGDESYALAIDAAGALIVARSDAGLFYGVQTIIQLLEQAQRERSHVPGLAINDRPTFDWRCRYFDASQYAGTIVNTRANLEHEIKLLARFKLNCLCFDAYNLVPFASFPYCADANTLSAGDWQYLVELAHQHHVTLIPSLQSLSQTYAVIWTSEEGKPYREETAPGLLCPSRPENIDFLRGLYMDLITTVKYSPLLGIGCSEVGMAWDKHYCPRCQQRIDAGETLHDIYYKHVRNCVEAVEAAAKEAGREVRPMMWADEFYMGYGGQRWVGIENIPTNTVMGHWMYWKPYDGMAGLLERGFDVFFLSATYQHNNLLVDLSPQTPLDGKWAALIDSGIRNIADQSQQAAADMQKDLPGKVLGGGCATFSQHDIRCWDTTWFAYALQAEYAWGDPIRPLDEELDRFTNNFAVIHYGARDSECGQVIAQAYRELDAVKSDLERNNYLIRDFIGIYDVQDASYLGNELDASLELINELAANPQGPGKTIEDIRQRCEHAIAVSSAYRQKLAQVAGRVQNTASLHSLISAAHKIENHARRTQFLLDLAEAERSLDFAEHGSKRAELSKVCQELIDDTQLIADQMYRLTHAGRLNADAADPSGYQKVLVSLEGFLRRLASEKD